MKTRLLIPALLLAVAVNAQNFKFGKISKEELLEKKHPSDSASSAAILYKKGRTYMDYDANQGWLYKHEVEARIKIYTVEGYDWATVLIPYYHPGSGGREKVFIQKAYTYNLVEGKIEKQKLRREGEFDENRNKRWHIKKITMPDVKEGSVLEYKYTITSPYISSLPEWKFQYRIPVNYMEYNVVTPEYFNYKQFQKGFFPIKREESRKNVSKTIRYEYQEAGTSAVGGYRTRTETLEYQETTIAYEAKNIPALKDEKYVNNINNFRLTVSHELSYTKFPWAPLKYYSQTWEDVTKKIYESAYFGEQLNKKTYFEEDINALLDGVTTPVEKIVHIFNYVQHKMNWNERYGYGCDKGVKKAYKESTGNAAEINLMLTAMLRHAGIDANPVLVSTRNHGIPLFPTIEGFNYVIAAVEMEGNIMLLDATDKNTIPNILPIRDLNWYGRLIRKGGSSTEVQLFPTKSSKATVFLHANIHEDGSVEGKYRYQCTDYNAMLARKSYKVLNKEKYLENIEKKYSGIEVSDYKATDVNKRAKPFQEEFSFIKENQCDVIGDKIYFSPMLFFASTENPFKSEKREFPVDFQFPKMTKYMINIQIPEHYTIESAPEPALIKLPDNLGTFKYNIAKTPDKLQVFVSWEINEAIISPLYYESLKEYFKMLVEKETEKVVLTKI